jgi:hypothetical protein
MISIKNPTDNDRKMQELSDYVNGEPLPNSRLGHALEQLKRASAINGYLYPHLATDIDDPKPAITKMETLKYFFLDCENPNNIIAMDDESYWQLPDQYHPSRIFLLGGKHPLLNEREVPIHFRHLTIDAKKWDGSISASIRANLNNNADELYYIAPKQIQALERSFRKPILELDGVVLGGNLVLE